MQKKKRLPKQNLRPISSNQATRPSVDEVKSPTQSKLDWKQHPLYVAAAASAATLVICLGVVKEIVLPTYSKGLENDVIELKRLKAQEPLTIAALNEKHAREISAIRDANKVEIDKATKQKQSAELQSSRETQVRNKLESELSKIGLKDLFQDKNPYPLMYQRVKLKDPFSSIREKYSDLKVSYVDAEKNITFRLNHKIFSELSFHAGKKSNNDADAVGNIVFTPTNQIVAQELSETLKTVLGKPSKESTNWVYWTGLTNYAVYLNRGKSPQFFITPAGAYPIMLDDD